jgi:hypothetical protein
MSAGANPEVAAWDGSLLCSDERHRVVTVDVTRHAGWLATKASGPFGGDELPQRSEMTPPTKAALLMKNQKER